MFRLCSWSWICRCSLLGLLAAMGSIAFLDSLVFKVAGSGTGQYQPTVLQTITAAQSPARSKSASQKSAAEGTSVNRRESKHFLLLTDLSVEESRDLLDRLETMLAIIEKYFDRKLRKQIPMVVAKDITAWPRPVLTQLEPDGIQQILDGAGVTLGITRQNPFTGIISDATCTVYAVADRGTPQHEAVHAYCIMTFGRTGPTWYSEGMAEIGQYWREKDISVKCHDIVLKYLQRSEPKKQLDEVVDTGDRTGDSWQNYAWRWVLCHMLSYNPNYASRFKPLGLGMLNGQDVSFQQVYGPMSQEISFEYDFFLKHINEGFRCDLCAWDWKAKYVTLKTQTIMPSQILAQRGWQPSKVKVQTGVTYEYSAAGSWKLTEEGRDLTANGNDNGEGQLWGVVFDDYQLGEPFPLSDFGTYTAESDGQLLLRCRDDFHKLADNSGKMSVKIKLQGKGEPLPRPVAPSASETANKSSSTKTKSARTPPMPVNRNTP